VERPLPDTDDFNGGWMAESLYQEFYDYVEPYMDRTFAWGGGGFTRAIVIPPGNMEFDQLEHGEPGEIRQRVRDQLSPGKKQLSMTTSPGPIIQVSRRLVENYKAWINAALEFGS
jgi:hypothetical protein